MSKEKDKESEIKRYPEIGRTYLHYKGGKYKVITMATHSETNEALVIYQSLHFGSYHARPLKMWFDKVLEAQVMKPPVYRFELIEDEKE